jgi:hypothetical protein
MPTRSCTFVLGLLYHLTRSDCEGVSFINVLNLLSNSVLLGLEPRSITALLQATTRLLGRRMEVSSLVLNKVLVEMPRQLNKISSLHRNITSRSKCIIFQSA